MLRKEFCFNDKAIKSIIPATILSAHYMFLVVGCFFLVNCRFNYCVIS